MLGLLIQRGGPALNDVVRHRRPSRCDESLVASDESGRNGVVSGQSSDTSNQRTVDGGQRSEGGIGFAGVEPSGYDTHMSTITAVLDADPDGTLHLPLPPDLHGTRIRIEAKLEATKSAPQAKGGLRAVMRQIRARNPFRAISDAAAWQRKEREDVSLPGRD